MTEINIEKAATDASADLVKKVTQIAMVGAVAGIVVFWFWPQIARMVEAVDTVKKVPAIETRVDNIETKLRDNDYERRDLRSRVDKIEGTIDRVAPRVPAAPPGWQVITVPNKPGL
jgi:hypothetical protein